jgi:carbon-monoxide dehydrogenase medium subunit
VKPALDAPEILIDINGLSDLAGIDVATDIIRIGALTRHKDIEQSQEIARHLPLLTAAAPHIGHKAIRNRGTIGGAVALGDPAAEWPACLLALNAAISAVGRGGTRRIEARDFFKGLYETDLAEDELVGAVEIPVPGKNHVWAFAELARRHGDFAMAGIAASATAGGSSLEDLNLAFFGVADRPVLARQAAGILTGKAITDKRIAEAQGVLDKDIEALDDVHCSAAAKLHFARQLLAKAVKSLGHQVT